jgi:hypothetical protein
MYMSNADGRRRERRSAMEISVKPYAAIRNRVAFNPEGGILAVLMAEANYATVYKGSAVLNRQQ